MTIEERGTLSTVAWAGDYVFGCHAFTGNMAGQSTLNALARKLPQFNRVFTFIRHASEVMNFKKIKHWAKSIKRDAITLWLAARDVRTPWYAKVLAAVIAAYALSPIDLIPDFIPVLGYLDDLIIVPLGILAVVGMIPPTLMKELRAEAAKLAERPVSKGAAIVIIVFWIAAIAASAFIGWEYFDRGVLPECRGNGSVPAHHD